MDIVFCTLLCQSLCEPNHGQLSSRVIALSKASKKTSSRSGVDNSSILLFPEYWPRSSGTLVCTLNMDGHNQIPVLVAHVLEADIPKNTGIVDQDIDSTEGLHGGFDDLVAVLDGIVVGDCFAASGFDLINDDICGL